MRFISKYGRYGVQVRPVVQEAYATGMAKVVQEPLYAHFQPYDLTPQERELALNHWSWNGFYQLEDEVTTMAPDYRIGLFDSVKAQEASGWTDEERIQVERALLDSGRLTNDIIPVPVTLFPPPWPRYDEFAGTTDELLTRLVEDGHVLDEVLEYERANQNRPELVRALRDLIDDPEALLELQPVAEEILG